MSTVPKKSGVSQHFCNITRPAQDNYNLPCVSATIEAGNAKTATL